MRSLDLLHSPDLLQIVLSGLLQIDICRFDTSSFINVHQVCKFQQACCKLMTSTSLLQLVDNLQHAGKIRNLQQVHGGHKRQLIRPRTNNFLSFVWNITKLLHRIELAIPKNPIVFVFRFCYISAGK
jgi:hypothetical protein